MSRQSTKNKKYALRKIGKFFGSCAVATVITLSGAAIMTPNVTVYASETEANPGEANIENITSASEGYEVFVPKGKKYERDDTVESHTPVLREEGYNGRSFILKAEDSDDYFDEHPMESLFEKLYDKDDNGQIDEKYKRADADTINENAGNPIEGTVFLEPKVSEVNPKYPHRLDAGISTPADPGNLYKGRPAGADGNIDSDDTIVESNKPITVDPNSEENIVNDDGTVVLSKYYRIHVNEGEHADKKDDIYVVGTKPKVEETPIPFVTRYEKDNDSPKGKETEVTPGVPGKTVTTTTYEVDPNTGKVTENPSTSETTDPVERVVKVGTKPKVDETPIPFVTRYEKDNDSPKGKETEVTPGVDGKTVTTTTYTVDPNTGKVTETPSEPVTTNPVERVVKVGTKPKVDETPIPFVTRYEKDDESPKGKETEVTPGVDGKTVTTTTYTVDPNTGKVTENPSEPVITNPVERVVKVGTKPKVDETPIPFVTRYEKDNDSPKGKETEVTPGVPGKTVTTTTYEVDPNTGKVTENPSTSVTTDPVTRVVKRGTQPKVEKTPIPFETRYEDDNSIPEGEEREVTAGVNGETVKTTTYAINPDTGEVTTNEPTSETTNPVTRVVKRGTKSKVEETPENPQPEQPGEGTPNGDKPIDKPTEGTPSGDKPTEGTPSGNKPTEGTPSGDKPTEGTSSSPESSTSHSTTPPSSSSTSTPEKPSKAETPAVRTVWRDENGKDLKVPSVDKQEAGEVEGYEFVESHREGDNVTVHVFRNKQAQTPSPAPSKFSEQKDKAVTTATSEKTVDSATSTKASDKAELPNTGTEANANLGALGLLGALSGFGLLSRKKKED